MTPAISVADLTRRYHGQAALDHVTFDVEDGSISGLLGRNGAGKTTLLRTLADGSVRQAAVSLRHDPESRWALLRAVLR
jgi:ABC-2 type transport system ATP-binding protein